MSKKVHQVKVHIKNNSESFIGEALYLAGNFNNWSEEHLKIGYIPKKNEVITVILPEVSSGDLELKISRGDWNSLSATKDGKLELPHVSRIQRDTEVYLSIDAWRDLFPKSTASKQVHVLDDHFFFPELNVYRKVWIYLPKSYSNSAEHFPVLYMHDGQHLFDEATSVGRAGPIEWMVDETLDESDYPSIIVAIDHAKTYDLRQQEYMINPGHGTEKPQGWAYLEDIVCSLKPYVDEHYRTLTDPQNTAIVGSSLGGLLNIYAGLKYPEIFGTAVAFSPSIWMDEEKLYHYSREKLKENNLLRNQQEFYFYIGYRERRYRKMDSQNNMKLDLDRYYSWLLENFKGELKLEINTDGKHGAIYWQLAFREFYTYWQSKINSLQINK